MAIMIPAAPDFGEHAERSQEKAMFNKLKESLSDEYYVFYSQRVLYINNGTLKERELDFVVFHKEKGLLYIEAKNGHPYCKDKTWYYQSGLRMPHNGPYEQASSGMHALMAKVECEYGSSRIKDRCRYIHAVWFWGLRENDRTNIPDAAWRQLTIFGDSDIQKEIDAIYSLSPTKEEGLKKGDVEWLFRHILAPSVGVSLLSIAKAKRDQEETAFAEMKREQVRLLNYLEEQSCAVINGCAGSGKTVLALEKAKRHAERNERVLFLCFNVKLKEYLDEKYRDNYIDFYNIDSWVAKQFKNSYGDAHEALYKCVDNYNMFPYKHVIVDEGQDFEEDRSLVLDLLKLIIEKKCENGEDASFYVFYDRNQLVQAKKCPEVITSADCKLTLYCNCRNTLNIARFLSVYLESSGLKIKLAKDHLLEGDNPHISFIKNDNDVCSKIHEIVDDYRKKYGNLKTIQILTNIGVRLDPDMDTEQNSCIKDCIKKESHGYFFVHNQERIPFTTSRKFKGLEADCVILLDINKEMLEETESLTLEKSLLYVGASRARTDLFMIVGMSEQECRDFTFKMWGNKSPAAAKVIAQKMACEILKNMNN